MPRGIYEHHSGQGKPFRKGHIVSEEIRKKLSIANNGKHYSPNTEFKKGIHPKTKFKEGHKPWNKNKKGIMPPPWNKGLKGFVGYWLGRKRPKETIEKIRKAKLGKIGKLSNNWKGGISVNSHSLTDPKYKQWRTKIFERDNFTCQNCGKSGCYIEPHHIKRWADYKELRYDVENGVTLCRDCHRLTRKKH